MHELFEFRQSSSALLISFPHDGINLPIDIENRLTKTGRNLVDTDWYISKVYDFIQDMDISYIKPNYSRYVVDLNRAPESSPLYPGKFETSVCPVKTFANDELYLAGKRPDADEIQERIKTYWRPYHQHIENEFVRIKKLHGFVVLLDAHSINGEIPNLFEGRLPDLNFGTADTASCSNEITKAIHAVFSQQVDYSFVFNGRFKGGYITRNYGCPRKNNHAIQLELNQSTYLHDCNHIPPKTDEQALAKISHFLTRVVDCILELRI